MPSYTTDLNDANGETLATRSEISSLAEARRVARELAADKEYAPLCPAAVEIVRETRGKFEHVESIDVPKEG